jgi:hypothetical protein
MTSEMPSSVPAAAIEDIEPGTGLDGEGRERVNDPTLGREMPD